MAERFLVTSALPYVNGVKHIGNVVGSLLPADVFARFLRLDGREVLFVCGTDEHGAPIEVAALKDGVSPKEYSDKYAKIQRDIYEAWGLSFDRFGRTSEKTNHETTQEIFLADKKNGFISEKSLKMPYCVNDSRYLPDRFIEGTCPNCGFDGARGDQCEKCGKVLDPADLQKPFCTICGKKDIEFRDTKHLFLDLDKLSDELKAWILSREDWPDNAKKFALGWIKDGLQARCITRDLEWGVNVPLQGYEDKVFYVWFDAPIGYISFTKEWCAENGQDWNRWWNDSDSKIVHFLGKDNVAFHTIIWPGMLMASKYCQLPYRVQSYEFLNLEGKKFSTSRKWGINSDEALDWLPVDYWRYYLMSILPEHSDSDFSLTEFQKAVNSDLNDTWGNLVHRCLTFINANYAGVMPAPGALMEEDEAFKAKIAERADKVKSLFYSYKLQEALRESLALARDANKYFNDAAPWKLVKTDKERAGTVLYVTANAIKSTALLLAPFTPASSQKVFDYLGQGALGGAKWSDASSFTVKGGAKIASKDVLAPLFAKMEDEKVAQIRAKLEERSKA
ncbi:methionine--tRNA ligase [Candidatus Micrarchaeota archaeon CG1_02_55_22]|nr:MAG: methionine--tRNA ligase [Candidatus Micrarchaeota archaeon CG1_02_55_22]